MDYLDFDIEIGAEQNGEYPVRVLDSPGGQAGGVFRMPFSGVMLDLQLEKLQTALLRSGGKHRLVLSEEERTVREFGRELFSGLIAGDVRARYAASLTRASDQRLGLRVKLRIRDPKLAALPWEFLYDPDRDDYVCLSDETPIVRYLELPRDPRALEIQPPLRVLGMIASPKNLPALDIQRERERIRRALEPLQNQGLVELEWVDGQNWRDLQRAMRQGPWHIFHFIGHGRFDPDRDEGQVALTGSDGYARLLPASDLGRLLVRERSLRLAVLNACQGAHSAGHDIFSSTASILVRAGLPAVVAMQYEITDAAAIEFSRAFYEALADGAPVDSAVTESRNAIKLAVSNTVEWGTPVLYMRSPDGNLFDVTGTPAPVKAQPEKDAGLEARLRELYLQANSAFWSEDYERAAGLFRRIHELNPDYGDSAAKLAQAEGRLKAARLYADAKTAVEREAWAEAEGFLSELVELDPNYQDAADLLSDVQARRELADLVAQAQDLYRHEQWQAVFKIFEQIRALDPDYPDPDGLLPSAQRSLQEQAELERLAELYAAGLAAMDAGEWAAAIDSFAKIEKRQLEYEDTGALLARARAELASEQHQAGPEPQVQETAAAAEALPAGSRPVAKQEERPGTSSLASKIQELPRWALIAGGVVGLVAISGILSGLAAWGGGLFAPVTQPPPITATESVAPTETIEPILTDTPLPATGTSRPAPTHTASEEPAAEPTGLPLALTDNNESPMVVIPAGPFEMGMDADVALEYCRELLEPFDDNECSSEWYLDEKPVHTVFLDDYYMDQYEVTNQQFAVFLNERGNQTEDGATWLDAEDAEVRISETGGVWAARDAYWDHPVVDVTWYGARAYCEWRGARLPTEAEWEKAARGDAGKVYPWGDTFDGDLANFCDANCNVDGSNPNYDDGYAGTAPVGSYPGGVSPHGLHDMAGNVWEWVADWYDGDYYGTLPDGAENPAGPATGELRVLRGGSWGNSGVTLRAANRLRGDPLGTFIFHGFRCARSP